MIQQEFVMLIMSCKKYENKVINQKKTWLNNLPEYLLYYHVIGDETMDEIYKFDNENKILWVKTLDDYNSLPNKVITSYKAIQETYDFKYLFKTDDDQILVKQHFFNIITSLIKKKEPTPHYGGFIVDVKIPYLSKYYLIHEELPKNIIIQKTKYCSGRFYFLSYKAVSNLLLKRENIIKEFLEDYAIGLNLDPFFKENIFSISTNDFFIDM